MNLSALIFDVDGTIAQTERDGHRVAFNLAFTELGLHWYWDESLYRELLKTTGGKERIADYAKRFQPEWWAMPDVQTRIAMVHHCKTKHYLSLINRGNIPLRDGVRELIAEAQARGLRLAIATTTTPDNVYGLINTHFQQEGSPFEVIAAGDIVPAKKPAPDIYTYVLQALNLPARACLAIEDSEVGLQSALGAGIPTVITQHEDTHGQDFTGAIKVLDSLHLVSINDLMAWHRES